MNQAKEQSNDIQAGFDEHVEGQQTRHHGRTRKSSRGTRPIGEDHHPAKRTTGRAEAAISRARGGYACRASPTPPLLLSIWQQHQHNMSCCRAPWSTNTQSPSLQPNSLLSSVWFTPNHSKPRARSRWLLRRQRTPSSLSSSIPAVAAV